VNLLGMFHNLFWVTLGNLLAGSVFMALGYRSYSETRGITEHSERAAKE
jgi:formate/nitrite transporter FocA (FNT family)